MVKLFKKMEFGYLNNMRRDRILSPEEIVQYARHDFTEINLDDLSSFYNIDNFDGFIIDVRPLRVIAPPIFFWKRGILMGNELHNPRIYLASYNLDKKNTPKDITSLDVTLNLDALQIIGKDIPCTDKFWKVKPIYSNYN